MRRTTIVLLAAGLLAGCSGTRPYTDAGEMNLRLRTKAESGSVFSSVRAYVHIYSVERGCKTKYLGTLDLDRPSVSSGLPVGRESYLVFAFNSSSFLGGTRGSISYETLLTPRRGYSYDVEVSYEDDMYNAIIREVNGRKRTRREVAARELADCRSP